MILCFDKLSKRGMELLRFSKTRELFKSWRLRSSLPSIILADLSGNRTLLKQVQNILVPKATRLNLDLVIKKRRALETRMDSKGHGLWLFVIRFVNCNWWVSIRFVYFCVSRLVACDRNYDWPQRTTQLWRRLLNFRFRVFVNSAV